MLLLLYGEVSLDKRRRYPQRNWGTETIFFRLTSLRLLFMTEAHDRRQRHGRQTSPEKKQTHECRPFLWSILISLDSLLIKEIYVCPKHEARVGSGVRIVILVTSSLADQ